MRILAVGDVVAAAGMEMVGRHLNAIKKIYQVDFTIVNGENACGVGITPKNAEELYRAGADVITLGNHTFRKQEIKTFLEEAPYILRPLNYSPNAPGRGEAIYDVNGISVWVINLIGRCDMEFGAENPFVCAKSALDKQRSDIIVIDFHAEATSEKQALGYYLNGQVSVVFGTHTHVQTADENVLSKGTGYITDIGMTGAIHSVIGVKTEQSISMFLGEFPQRLEAESGPAMLCGAVFDVDETAGKCRSVERIRITD